LRERADAAAFRALRCALRLTAGHPRHCSAAPLRTNTRERPRPVHTPAWCRGCGTNPARDASGNPKKRSIALGPALALPGAFRCRRRHPRYARRLSGKPGGWREVVRNRQQLDFGGDQISPAKRSIAARQPYTTSVLRRPARVCGFSTTPFLCPTATGESDRAQWRRSGPMWTIPSSRGCRRIPGVRRLLVHQ